MKKLLLFIFLFISISLYAQVAITMEQDGGVYKVPCVVNGAKMKFIFDTGAATVCLSESMAEYLMDNDYISKEDFVGTGTSTVADGRTVSHLKIILKDIEIAGLHLKDVEASIVEGQRAPLLLGQTAIQKLGKVSIDGNKLIINNGESDYQVRLNQLKQKAEYYDELQAYSDALPFWESYYTLLWENQHPQDEDYYNMGECYYRTNEYKNAIKYYSLVENKENNVWLQQHMGIAYYNIGNYRTAIVLLEKIDQISFDLLFREYQDICRKYGKEADRVWDDTKADFEKTYADDFESRIERYIWLSHCYTDNGQYDMADNMASIVIKTYFMGKYPNYYTEWETKYKKMNILDFIASKKIRDTRFAMYILNGALIYAIEYGGPHCKSLRIAAEMGNADARKFYYKYRCDY